VRLNNLAYVQGVLDSLFALPVEQHELLLLARQGAEETRPKVAGDRLLPRENESLVLFDVLSEEHIRNVRFLQAVALLAAQIVF